MAVEMPLPTAENAAYLVLGILIGLPAPYWFAAERVKGFSRAMLMKIPYQPPPGVEEGEAMEEAVEDS